MIQVLIPFFPDLGFSGLEAAQIYVSLRVVDVCDHVALAGCDPRDLMIDDVAHHPDEDEVDALLKRLVDRDMAAVPAEVGEAVRAAGGEEPDRKSTRLNASH